MKVIENRPPREFEAGYGSGIIIKDCAHIELAVDEQVTFESEGGAEYDVARKSWGFYATPSINGRLEGFGFQTFLVKNRVGRFYIMLVERDREGDFKQYVLQERLTVCGCLNDSSLPMIEKTLAILAKSETEREDV